MSDTITEDALDAIRQRCTAATEGPWVAYVEGRDQAFGGATFIMRGENRRRDDLYLDGGTVADYDFVANAKQDIPLLLDEIERLHKEIEMLRGEIVRLQKFSNF